MTKVRTPIPLWIPAAGAVALVALPLAGIVVRTPWRTIGGRISGADVMTAFRLSLECSLGALAISIVLGVPLGWILGRIDFPGKAVVRSLVLLPLVLPPVVGGIALLLAFGPRGLLGPALQSAGIVLPFRTPGAILAEAFVALPFLTLSVEGAVAGLDIQFEEVASTLGARPLRVFGTITLRLIGPALAAGAALAWARALGEFGATITFAGNLPGQTQTLPVAVYQLLQDDPDAAIAVSLLLLVVSLALLAVLRGRWLAPLRTP